uniref:Uncharacterized protein n=1 Tax=Rodentolepis nana TaxID=102285 RepID=A0A0R3TFC6_RODNA
MDREKIRKISVKAKTLRISRFLIKNSSSFLLFADDWKKISIQRFAFRFLLRRLRPPPTLVLMSPSISTFSSTDNR